ncbi:MAG: hypothetical protein IMY80_08260 [Chloroflexi bacterium]|nr:hypothetical protein [Chloroflexota bacterium]
METTDTETPPVEMLDSEIPSIETMHATSLPLLKAAAIYGHILMNNNVKRPVD